MNHRPLGDCVSINLLFFSPSFAFLYLLRLLRNLTTEIVQSTNNYCQLYINEFPIPFFVFKTIKYCPNIFCIFVTKYSSVLFAHNFFFFFCFHYSILPFFSMSPLPLFDCFGIQQQKKRERRKMPCTNCMAEYTRRRKEIGCAMCRFGFCERCVAQKCVVPSVSPAKPVPVCSNCYKMLTEPVQQCRQSSRPGVEKSRSLPPIGLSPLRQPQQNVWGTDRLPPPSLRSLYTMPTKGDNKNAQWDELETRLARLNNPNQFGEPQTGPSATTGEQQTTNGPKATHHANNVRQPRAPPIEELEERLAALRGVPVEVVRKPRLMVINDDDNDEEGNREMPLSDEAAQLLRRVEQLGACAPNLSSLSNTTSDTAAGTAKKQQTLDTAADQCSLNSECPSAVLQNVIADALRAPSPSNVSSRTMSDDGGQLYPNFAECVRKTLEDAQIAEREAMEFIRKYDKQPNNNPLGQPPADPLGTVHLISDRKGSHERADQ